MDKPVVSVIMPVHNGEKYLRQAMDSVFCQDVPLELLVIDDNSTDGTADLLRHYGRELPAGAGERNAPPECFRYFRNEKNLGAGASRNRGVKEARGEFVAFLDADDWWEKGKLAAQLKTLRSTGYVLCSTGRRLVKPDGTRTGKYIPVKETITLRELLKHNSINCSSVMLRRDVAEEFPMGHEDSHEDYITWLGILKKYGKAAGINKPYLCYRLSESGKSRNKLKSAVMTYKAYRYAGYGVLKSAVYFISYAVHGVMKYM